jgi:hypothetical protein
MEDYLECHLRFSERLLCLEAFVLKIVHTCQITWFANGIS